MLTRSPENYIMNNCALYLRLSKEDEKGVESVSIETQRKILRDYARKNGFVIYDEYVDDGFTGTNLNRPAFQRMLGDVEAGKIQVIITKDLSRLGRNSGRVNILLDEYFPEHHVRYISVSEGIDTAERTAVNSIVAPVQNLVNELYAGDISRKIHAAFDIKMKAGEYISAFAPYGYRKDPANKNHLLIDETSGAIVKRIFSLAREGYSPSQIAGMLNEDGIITPSKYRCYKNPHLDEERLRASVEWKAANINKMLRNEVYLGHTLQGKTVKPSFKSKYHYINPRENWIVVRNTHEALIDEETWAIVRKRVQNRTQKKNKGFVNIFSGLAKCADCGKSMSTVGTRKKGATANLVCGGYKLGGLKYCTNHVIDYDIFYQMVLTALQKQIRLTEKEKQKILEAIAKDAEHQDNSQEIELENKIETITKKLEQLFEDKYDNLIGQDQFKRLHEKYRKELENMKAKKEAVQAELGVKRDLSERKRRYEQFRNLIDSYDDLQVLDTELLFKLIDHIDVHQGEYIDGVKHQQIEIWFRFQCEPEILEIDVAPR